MGIWLSGQRPFHACHTSVVLESEALPSFQGIRGISAQIPGAVSFLSVLFFHPFFSFLQFLRAIWATRLADLLENTSTTADLEAFNSSPGSTTDWLWFWRSHLNSLSFYNLMYKNEPCYRLFEGTGLCIRINPRSVGPSSMADQDTGPWAEEIQFTIGGLLLG